MPIPQQGDCETTPVLIVGGGLAGLSAALFLSWRGVNTLLVDKHASSSQHPRAIGFTPRTLEIFRAVGIGARIPQVTRKRQIARAASWWRAWRDAGLRRRYGTRARPSGSGLE